MEPNELADSDRRERGRGLLPAVTPAVRAKKALGQHFLVDENILGVIGRLAALGPEDVVLEVGPGLGVLTSYLADRVSFVHAVEIDRTLERELAAAIGERANVGLVFGDAMRLDLDALSAACDASSSPTFRTTSPRHSSSRASTACRALGSWCVMVQREIADRFFAEPGTKAYGAVSVLVQLAAERTGFHAVSRTVFRPRAARRVRPSSHSGEGRCPTGSRR